MQPDILRTERSIFPFPVLILRASVHTHPRTPTLFPTFLSGEQWHCSSRAKIWKPGCHIASTSLPESAPSPRLTGCSQARPCPGCFGAGRTAVGVPAHGVVLLVGELGVHFRFCHLQSEENKARVPEWLPGPQEAALGGVPCGPPFWGGAGSSSLSDPLGRWRQVDGRQPLILCLRGQLALGARDLLPGDCKGALGGSSVTECPLALCLFLSSDCVSFCVFCSPASWVCQQVHSHLEGLPALRALGPDTRAL